MGPDASENSRRRIRKLTPEFRDPLSQYRQRHTTSEVQDYLLGGDLFRKEWDGFFDTSAVGPLDGGDPQTANFGRWRDTPLLARPLLFRFVIGDCTTSGVFTVEKILQAIDRIAYSERVGSLDPPSRTRDDSAVQTMKSRGKVQISVHELRDAIEHLVRLGDDSTMDVTDLTILEALPTTTWMEGSQTSGGGLAGWRRRGGEEGGGPSDGVKSWLVDETITIGEELFIGAGVDVWYMVFHFRGSRALLRESDLSSYFQTLGVDVVPETILQVSIINDNHISSRIICEKIIGHHNAHRSRLRDF